MSSLSEILGGETTPYKLMQQQIMSTIRVSMPGTIETFDAASQTVSVKPSINDSIIHNGKRKWVPLPIIEAVPVSFPRGGDWAVTLPVKPGDACILVFADSCIDGFQQSGQESTQAEVRHHDLSDAMAIVGISTGNAPVPGYSPDHLELRNKSLSVKISLPDGGVTITSPSVSISAPSVDIAGSVAVTGALSLNGRGVETE